MAYNPRGRMRIDQAQAKTLHWALLDAMATTETSLEQQPLSPRDKDIYEGEKANLKALQEELSRTMQDFGWAP